jgi:hypothetical protein
VTGGRAFRLSLPAASSGHTSPWAPPDRSRHGSTLSHDQVATDPRAVPPPCWTSWHGGTSPSNGRNTGSQPGTGTCRSIDRAVCGHRACCNQQSLRKTIRRNAHDLSLESGDFGTTLKERSGQARFGAVEGRVSNRRLSPLESGHIGILDQFVMLCAMRTFFCLRCVTQSPVAAMRGQALRIARERRRVEHMFEWVETGNSSQSASQRVSWHPMNSVSVHNVQSYVDKKFSHPTSHRGERGRWGNPRGPLGPAQLHAGLRATVPNVQHIGAP